MKLKPCPFCGGQAALIHAQSVDDPDIEDGWLVDMWEVICVDGCATAPSTDYKDTKLEAIEAWNERGRNE